MGVPGVQLPVSAGGSVSRPEAWHGQAQSTSFIGCIKEKEHKTLAQLGWGSQHGPSASLKKL